MTGLGDCHYPRLRFSENLKAWISEVHKFQDSLMPDNMQPLRSKKKKYIYI